MKAAYWPFSVFPLLLLSFLLSYNGLLAQGIDVSSDFSQLLDQVEAQLILPVETDYRDILPGGNRSSTSRAF